MLRSQGLTPATAEPWAPVPWSYGLTLKRRFQGTCLAHRCERPMRLNLGSRGSRSLRPVTYRPKPACMLRSAMLHLKVRKGASFAQIRKHLEQRNRNGAKLDPGHKRLLTNALRGLVRSGDVAKHGLMYVLRDQRHESAPEAAEETPTKPHLQQRTVPHRRKYRKTHSKHHYARRRRRRHHKRWRRRRSRRRHRRRRHHWKRRRSHRVGHRHGRHCKRHPGQGVHCHRLLRMVFPLRRSFKKRY